MYLSDEQANNKDLILYLASQVFSEPITNATRLSGTMSYTYDINHKHIFKLPNEYTQPDDWLHQEQLAPLLQKHFTFQIPHPHLTTIYTPDKKSILSSSYPKIDGICWDNDLKFAAQKPSFKNIFFENLADAAAQIHTVPLHEIPFELPTKIDSLEKRFFKNMSGDTYLPKKLFHKLMHSSFWGLGKSALKTSLLAHTDLHSGNVLLNDKNELVAVLDFDMLTRGDRFLEFQPGLYPDYSDMYRFQRIYEERTGIKINSDDLGQLQIATNSLKWFCSLYNLYRFLPIPERNKKMKSAVRNKIFSERFGLTCT